jgi:DNA-binding Lrp family transcriptional regulator
MNQLTVVACLAFDHRAPADGMQEFKNCILGCPYVDRAMEVCGTFDLIVQGHCEDIAEYTAKMERLREPLSSFVARIETSFVVRMIDRSRDAAKTTALWLPCEHGRKRVESHMIDKVVAEGDYMKVHVGDWNCLMHATMERLSRRLKGCGFIKLHRSWLVRIGFIERLVHDDNRWVARLLDGTHVPVAKSHVQDVLKIISDESSKADVNSSVADHSAERASEISEKIMTSRA